MLNGDSYKLLTWWASQPVCSERRKKAALLLYLHPPHLHLCLSPRVPAFLISCVMKTSHARTETAPSFSHPPTSSIINGCFHYELPGALNRSQSFSGEQRDGWWTAWDISSEKSGWRAYLCGYFKEVSLVHFSVNTPTLACRAMLSISAQFSFLFVGSFWKPCECENTGEATKHGHLRKGQTTVNWKVKNDQSQL